VGDDAAERVDGAVANESWFLGPFCSVPYDTESMWLPPLCNLNLR
jgi:hypothetical protein